MRKLKPKRINLYARYCEKPQQTAAKRLPTRRVCLTVGAVLVAALLAGGYLHSRLRLRDTRQALSVLRLQTDDPLLVQEAEQSEEQVLAAQLAEQVLAAQQADMDALQTGQAAVLPEALLRQVLACAGTRVAMQQLQVTDGVVGLEASVAESSAISEYLAALEETGLFSSVNYDGYRQEGERFVFAVRAKLQ